MLSCVVEVDVSATMMTDMDAEIWEQVSVWEQRVGRWKSLADER